MAHEPPPRTPAQSPGAEAAGGGAYTPCERVAPQTCPACGAALPDLARRVALLNAQADQLAAAGRTLRRLSVVLVATVAVTLVAPWADRLWAMIVRR